MSPFNLSFGVIELRYAFILMTVLMAYVHVTVNCSVSVLLIL